MAQVRIEINGHNIGRPVRILLEKMALAALSNTVADITSEAILTGQQYIKIQLNDISGFAIDKYRNRVREIPVFQDMTDDQVYVE